jgi:hypothetical protein
MLDDLDQPLVIRSPLFIDPMTDDICELLQTDTFNIHFFDEYARELLAYRVRNAAVWRRRLVAHTLRFVPVSFDLARDFHDQMVLWFEGRGPEDDSDAIELSFVEALPDDIAILDATEQAFHGVQRRVTTIDRGGEPGAIQERDIALRVFEGDEVYLNPVDESGQRGVRRCARGWFEECYFHSGEAQPPRTMAATFDSIREL